MLASFARSWSLIAVRGLVAIVFGILAIVWPQATVLALVYVFGAFAIADGLLTLIGGFQTHKEDESWGMLVGTGLVEMVLGVLVLIWPQITAQVFVFLVAAWAIIVGILEIVAATELRRVLENEWLMLLSGVLSIVFGVLLIVYPGAGAISLVWLIGIYAIVAGILDIVFAFRLRGLVQKVEKTFKTGTV